MAQINISVTDRDSDRIGDLAAAAGLSRAALVREALAFYASRTSRSNSDRVRDFARAAFSPTDLLLVTATQVRVRHADGTEDQIDDETLRVATVRGMCHEALHLECPAERWRVFVGVVPALDDVTEALGLPCTTLTLPASALHVAAMFDQPTFSYPTT